MKLVISAVVLASIGWASIASAEVTRVSIASRAVVAGGQAFGTSGPYEKLSGTIEFALDSADPHNKKIVDLEHAPRSADGYVHFSADLYVLRPTDAARGNGVLLFEIANRGRKGLLNRFNRAVANNDPTAPADFGDGFLMREGYTLVWIGWEFDVMPPLMRIDAPIATFPSGTIVEPLSVDFFVNEPSVEAALIDEPVGRPPVRYLPVDANSATDVLTVRDRYWDRPVAISRAKWRFVIGADDLAKVHLDGGFEPGRLYEMTYHAKGPRVAGVGLAAIRDAAAAFRYRSDLPVSGRAAYVFGASQSGRFLREFLYEGFNVDEHDRQVFAAVWPHIAGAAIGPMNVRFAIPTHGGGFVATRFPFTDLDQQDVDGTRDGLEHVYRPDQRPKIFYSNTSVEYWGGGRAAALIHTTIDGKRDADIPSNVRIYLLSGTQHAEAAFPPVATNGQQMNNPTPQADVMRALLRALHQWVTNNRQPPESRYPHLSDGTLVPVNGFHFTKLSGVADPRLMTGPARVVAGKVAPLPYLVPQVDADGNEVAGIRVPDLAVPLATTTGWNFRAPAIGNPGEIYHLLGSYLPFATTVRDREARGDPRRSIEERYRTRDDYVARVRSAAADLIRGRYLLGEDLDDVMDRASAHWTYATRGQAPTSALRR